MKIREGKLCGEGLKIGIIVSKFNEFVTSKLKEGSIHCLLQHGVHEDDIEIVLVPGSLEILIVAEKMAEMKSYDALICIGAIIRGSTSHFEYISRAVSAGIARISIAGKIPVIFSVLTTDTLEQAMERSGAKAGNKGWDAALTAIEMGSLLGKW